MTPEQRNILRAYINTDSGKALLMLLLNEETTSLALTYSKKATVEQQNQLINRVAGLYWVRSLINDLIEIPKK